MEDTEVVEKVAVQFNLLYERAEKEVKEYWNKELDNEKTSE